MINKKYVNTYCKDDICLIENYNLAVNSDEMFDCHHRKEIETDGTIHSVKWLKDNDLYYNRPACELIFLTKSEHNYLHKRGKNHPLYGKHHAEETKIKMSEAQKGEKGHMYGKKHSEETKKKIGGRKWMTNGLVTIRVKQNDINTYLSNGYVFGRNI